MASKSYTLLEYLVTIEMELKKLKKIVAESVGSDYSELIAQINGIGQELNSFKSSISNTVNTNNSEITSKFNSLEQQFNTFKTSITNTVNSNNSTLSSQLSTLTTNFNDFKTTLERQVSGLTTRMANVENRVTSLENSGGSSGGSVDLTEVNSRISTAEGNITTLQSDVSSLKGRVSSLENNQGSTGGSSGESDGYGEKLITKYTITGNQEIHFSSFNFETGEGTTNKPHGLTSATEIIIVPNDWSLKNRNNNILSIPSEWITNNDKIKVVPVDDITLKVTKNDGITLIPVNTSATDNAGVNINKFHFEIPAMWSIEELPIATNHVRILIKGYIKAMQSRYLAWKTKDKSGNITSQPMYKISIPPKPNTNSTHAIFGIQNLILDFRDEIAMLTGNNIFEGRKTGSVNLTWNFAPETINMINSTAKTGKEKLYSIAPHTNVFNVFSNNTVIYIYDLGGTY